jgi:SSS family solute:Na+ symporter
MPRLADHHVELAVFAGLFVLAMGLGLGGMRWRRPATFDDIDEWGLGGRSFGPCVTWLLLGGGLYTAYTFVAVPALVSGVGAAGFFAIPFAVIAYPLGYVALTRLWSVAHVHRLVTPADFVRIRFGSRTLALLVAVVGIVATMPYLALQLVGVEAVLKTMGVGGNWPLVVAFTALALSTYYSGLRGPALVAFLKATLLLTVIVAVVLLAAMTSGSWAGIFGAAADHFADTPSRADGLLLDPGSHLSYLTLAFGSALGLFLYPHAITGVLAARSRDTVARSLSSLPVFTFVLGLLSVAGFLVLASGVTPLGADAAAGLPGDHNTVIPRLFDASVPGWCAGAAYAAIGVGALVPAAVMSIGAANLFTRNIYQVYLRPHSTNAEQARVSRVASLAVKVGALAAIVFLDPQFSIDLQLIGGVVILQTLPAVGIGLYTAWLHRYALVAGLAAGVLTGLLMLYQVPALGPDGTVTRAHFGGSTWSLANLGVHSGQSIYVGLIAVAVNLAVAAATTPMFRAMGVADGVDRTRPRDYAAEEGDPYVHRLAELVDGAPANPLWQRHAGERLAIGSGQQSRPRELE